MTQPLPKPEVGQEFFVVDTGNRARHGKGKQRPGTVTKVGRKYFTVEFKLSEDSPHTQEATFRLHDYHQHYNYSAEYALYPSREAWAAKVECDRWRSHFRQHFSQYGELDISVEQYREAAKILGLSLTGDTDAD